MVIDIATYGATITIASASICNPWISQISRATNFLVRTCED